MERLELINESVQVCLDHSSLRYHSGKAHSDNLGLHLFYGRGSEQVVVSMHLITVIELPYVNFFHLAFKPTQLLAALLFCGRSSID